MVKITDSKNDRRVIKNGGGKNTKKKSSVGKKDSFPGKQHKRKNAEEVNDLYKKAQELLQPPMSQEKFRALVEIKKQAEALLSPDEEQRQLQQLRHLQARAQSHRDGRKNLMVPYPSVTNQDFNKIIPRKKEFAMGAYPPVNAKLGVQGLWDEKCKPNEFILTPNQQVLKNFLSPTTPYNGLLLFHGVGTGKTCAAITIAEQFPDKRVLVLVQPGLQSNFRDHIFDFRKLDVTETGMVDVMRAAEQCTGTRYLSSIPDAELSNKGSVMKRIERAIKSRYTFRGTQVFAKEVHRIIEESPQGWEERLRQKYSNYVIVVDEAHHLRINLKDEEKKAVTPAIRKVLQYAEGVKLLLLTATPMFNDTTDIVELLNLLLTNDKRKPVSSSHLFDKRGNLTPEGEKTLIESSRGYVSYLRGDDPFSFPLRLNPVNTGDPNALKPDDPSHPSLNIKGQPISSDERMRQTVLMASDMSAYQRQAYAYLDRELKDVADASSEAELIDEVQEDEAGRENSIASTFMYGMGISNVVYPLQHESAGADTSVAAKLMHGKTGFNNCFVQAPGKGLRVKYADPSRPFLSGASLGVYAPKIKTIVDRILNSEGIVFVYSKFLDSGIIPLAIALEHVGIQRYGQNNILHEDAVLRSRDSRESTSGGGVADVSRKKWTYVAITARKNDLSMNKEAEVAAARSPDNFDGSRVKVILGSDNASEGLDFQNIREVHILDPWYHFNKTEQIIGRAARNCSHAALPVEKRNVTVYLHAARIRGSPRETIDIRAYRIAEQKQRRILRVEQMLISNSVDCNLNKHTQFYDPNKLNLRLNVLTSQGKVLPKYAIGDRYPRQKVSCRSDLDVLNLHLDQLDGSTYDAILHAGGIHSCKAVFTQMFRHGHAFTLDQVRAACKSVFPTVSDDAILMAVQETLDDHTPVQNPRGNDGYIIYASNKYMFQSRYAFDERDGLDDPLRTGPSPEFSDQGALPKALVFKARSSTESRTKSRSASQRAASKLDGDALSSDNRGKTSPVTNEPDNHVFGAMSLEILYENVAELKSTLGLDDAFEDVILDFYVDRLDESSMLRIIKLLLAKNASSVKKKKINENDDRVLESLKRGYVLWTDDGVFRDKKPSAFYMYDYFNDIYRCFDNATLDAVECGGPFSARASAGDRGKAKAEKTNYRNLRGYIVHPTGAKQDVKPRSYALFKMLGVSAESSGCVCHQTSSVKLEDVVKKIDEVNPRLGSKLVYAWEKKKGGAASPRSSSSSPASATMMTRGGGKAFDKKQLCVLYELALRYTAPEQFARPAIAARIFRQKGKRMITASSKEDAEKQKNSESKAAKASRQPRPAGKKG